MAIELTAQQLRYLPPELQNQLSGFSDESMGSLQKVLQSQVEGGVFSAITEANTSRETARSIEQSIQNQRNNALITQQSQQQIADEYARTRALEEMRSRLAKELELERAVNGLGEASLKSISQKMGQ